MLLSQKGINVDIADNGQIGVNMFRGSASHTYDLILMDIRMPVMNGYEAAKAVRASSQSDSRTIPIIAMTADAYPEDVEKAMQSGMNGHIAKPIDPDHLFDVLQQMMNQKK